MNDIPRQKLCEIIIQYGRSVCDDPLRLEGLLRDFCGQHRREIFILVSTLKEKVPAELLSSKNSVPQEVLLARLSKRIQENLGFAEDTARWAVESWALALGVLSSTTSHQQKPPELYPPSFPNLKFDEQGLETEEKKPSPKLLQTTLPKLPTIPKNRWKKALLTAGGVLLLGLGVTQIYGYWQAGYPRLQWLLKTKNWADADMQTTDIMLQAANRTKFSYLTPESIQNISCEDLNKINRLWEENSDGRFGFRIQNQVWKTIKSQSQNDTALDIFFRRVGWLSKEDNVLWLTWNRKNIESNAPKAHLPLGWLVQVDSADGSFASSGQTIKKTHLNNMKGLFKRLDICGL
ncbi:hypothetical protein F7734_32630 [Scytonema sp. UIC 10036]|uniref:GUN4 domain-containing protein n=1 Tax=Scytonema sp. UIC 10036 TaxID=2304196 RepID=UPI0012DAA8C1|nr:GUN4 domain-containing protein [Scytonema sp. UIC 10036]MUG96833.1 hypothetical protein [Scytonema sp. UIC 10036]